MPRPFPLVALLTLVATVMACRSAPGDPDPAFARPWFSRFEVDGQETEVVLHIEYVPGGSLALTVDVPARRRLGETPSGGYSFDGRSLTFRLSAETSFTGRLNNANTAIDGTLTTGERTRPVRFTQVPAPPSPPPPPPADGR